MKVLVINAGSSSCKYQLLEMDTETVLASGLAERIGQGIFMKYLTADGDVAGEGEVRRGGFGSTGR